MEEEIKNLFHHSKNRIDFWINICNHYGFAQLLEIGVYKGDFAVKLLHGCKSIRKYYMIDPWQKLENWNKPCDVSKKDFEEIFNELLLRTDFAKDKRKVLRGRTTDMIQKINDYSLDFIYIDGDHTLR